MKLKSAKLLLASVVLGGALSACVVAPDPGYGYGGVVAYSAPPAPQYEVVGVAPYPGAIWIGGSYFWEGGRYDWHPGYWERPRPGYRWAPHGWHRDRDGWREERGHWQRYR